MPEHGLNYDQEAAPLGSGIAVLIGLGGAYFVRKKRKEE
jgi:LPXTG-motif cell wall-anchored protein